MVPPNDPDALRIALEQVCQDDNLRARLIRSGLETASVFGREKMVERFLSLVNDLGCRHGRI